MEINLGTDETNGGKPLGRRGVSVLALVLGSAFFLAGLGALSGSFRQSTGWIGCLAGGIFTATGATVVAIVLAVGRRHRTERARRAEHPDAPWRWRSDWARGEVPARTGARAAATWGFALFWNAVSSPVCWFLPAEWAKGNYAAALGLIFPAVGLGLLAAAVVETLRWLRGGRCVFRLENDYGALGGELRGRIVLARPLRATADPVLRLSCTRRTSGDGNNDRDVCLWEHEVRLDHSRLPAAGATELPVVFALPAGQPTSTLTSGFGSIVWKLTLRAPQSGPDLQLDFEVPVFAAPAGERSNPFRQFTAYTASVDPALYRPADAAAALAQAGLVWRETSRDDAELTFPAGRSRAVGITTGLIALAAAGGAIAALAVGAPWLVAVVAAFFAAVLGVVAHSTLFDGSAVRITADRVTITRDRLAGRKTVELRRADVAHCEITQSMSSGDRVWYALTLIGRPLGDGALSPAGAEPFAVRKLRYQSARAAAHAPARAAELLREVAAVPAFKELAGSGIRGAAAATTIAGFLEEKIRGDATPAH